MSKAIEEMIEETRLAERRVVARKMLRRGDISLEDIAEYTGVPLSELEEMAHTKGA